MEGGSPLRSRLGNRPAWTTLQCSVGRLGPSGWSKEGKDGGGKPAALAAGESSSMDDVTIVVWAVSAHRGCRRRERMEGGSPLRSRLGNRPAWTTLQCSVGRLGPSGRSKEGKDGGGKPAALAAGESSSTADVTIVVWAVSAHRGCRRRERMEGGSPLRSRLGNRPAWTTLQCSVGRLGPSGWSKEGKDGGWKPAALGAGESSSMDDTTM
jgi:uncharacterized protein GlcG (DUF336 family)